MQIAPQKVVTLNYVLKDDQGNILDQSSDASFAYLHGANNIIPGLENALTDKQAGDKLEVSIPPEEAYGLRDEAKIQDVPREMFPADENIQPGMQFQAQAPTGEVLMVTVAKVSDEFVTVDGNHPLAGVRLNFSVEVMDVRDATEEEIAHGHVHTA